MGAPVNPLASQIAALWQRNKPVMRERLQLLERAATQMEQTGAIEAGLRKQATEVAHKLAGSLGMFGHTGATESARAIEVELETSGSPDASLLRQHVQTLHTTLHEPLA
ncbi:MAG: Hpt domain-containing protein [Acidobacteria bacterium]|nr:Hpt domain-containing protein [Acidobacteriota bacterium]